MHLRHLTLSALVALGLVLAPAGPAGAAPPPAGQGEVRSLGTTCNSQDGFVDIGGKIRVKELGKHAVTRFRVKWLLYNTDLSSPGIHVAHKRKTQESPSFPNDGRNFYDDFAKTWDTLVATDDGYTLIAKVTWVRANRRDWNQKYTVAYCS